MNWLKTRRKLEEEARYYEQEMEKARAERDQLERMYQELRTKYRSVTGGA